MRTPSLTLDVWDVICAIESGEQPFTKSLMTFAKTLIDCAIFDFFVYRIILKFLDTSLQTLIYDGAEVCSII